MLLLELFLSCVEIPQLPRLPRFRFPPSLPLFPLSLFLPNRMPLSRSPSLLSFPLPLPIDPLPLPRPRLLSVPIPSSQLPIPLNLPISLPLQLPLLPPLPRNPLSLNPLLLLLPSSSDPEKIQIALDVSFVSSSNPGFVRGGFELTFLGSDFGGGGGDGETRVGSEPSSSSEMRRNVTYSVGSGEERDRDSLMFSTETVDGSIDFGGLVSEEGRSSVLEGRKTEKEKSVRGSTRLRKTTREVVRDEDEDSHPTSSRQQHLLPF